MSVINFLFIWTALLLTGLSPLLCFPNLSILVPSHLFSAHSWKPHFCSFLAIFHFFLFLLLFNCEKYFLLQEKCPYALAGALLFIICRKPRVVFNVHPENQYRFIYMEAESRLM